MQKIGADRMPRIGFGGGQRAVLRAFFRSPIWVGGIAVMLGGWVLFLKALANAPVSIVQPVLGFGLCLLALFSVVFLRERLRSLEWLGVGLMVGGIVLLGISGSQEVDHARSVSLVALAGVSVVILGVLGGVVRSAGDGRRIPLAVVLGFASGVLIGLAALYTKALFMSLGQGATVIAWTLFLPLTLAANIGGLWVNQAGFQHGRALIVVAMNAVTNKIVSIVGGMVTLGEPLPADKPRGGARARVPHDHRRDGDARALRCAGGDGGGGGRRGGGRRDRGLAGIGEKRASMSRPDAPGRGTAANPPNRHEPLHVELDPEPGVDDDREPGAPPTVFYRYASRSILAENDSPDVGFRSHRDLPDALASRTRAPRRPHEARSYQRPEDTLTVIGLPPWSESESPKGMALSLRAAMRMATGRRGGVGRSGSWRSALRRHPATVTRGPVDPSPAPSPQG